MIEKEKIVPFVVELYRREGFEDRYLQGIQSSLEKMHVVNDFPFTDTPVLFEIIKKPMEYVYYASKADISDATRRKVKDILFKVNSVFDYTGEGGVTKQDSSIARFEPYTFFGGEYDFIFNFHQSLHHSTDLFFYSHIGKNEKKLINYIDSLEREYTQFIDLVFKYKKMPEVNRLLYIFYDQDFSWKTLGELYTTAIKRYYQFMDISRKLIRVKADHTRGLIQEGVTLNHRVSEVYLPVILSESIYTSLHAILEKTARLKSTLNNKMKECYLLLFYLYRTITELMRYADKIEDEDYERFLVLLDSKAKEKIREVEDNVRKFRKLIQA